MKNHIIAFLAIILILNQVSLAENGISDSLLNLAENSSGEEQARYYNEAAKYLFSTNPNASIKYAEMAMGISISQNLIQQEFQAYSSIGIAWSYIGENNKALDYHLRALEKFGDVLSAEDLALLHNELGIDYSYLYNHEKALEHFLLSLDLKEKKLGNEVNPTSKKLVAASQTNIGMVFARMGNHRKALEYYKKGMVLYSETEDSMSMAKTYNNMGIAYDQLGDYENAQESYFAALSFLEHSGTELSKAKTYSNLGIVYLLMDKPEISLEYNLKASTIFSQTGDQFSFAISTNAVGRAYLKMNRPNEALPYLLQGLETANTLGALGLLRDSYTYLSEYYALIGDYKRAYEYREKQIEVKDSLFSVDMVTRTTELQTKYETEKHIQEIELLTKDAEIKDLEIERQNAFAYALIGVVVIIILVGFLWFSRLKEKQKREKSELENTNLQTEQKLLRVQINPHFMFNALNSVQSYISANDNLKAMSYLAKFSLLMRNILDNSRKPMITLEDEINTLKLYIELESMRFKNAFDFEINIHPKIVAPRTYIPPMLIQPFVENSIKHGFRNLDRKGKLIIDFYNINGLVSCSIEDNGIGRKKATELSQTNNNRHKSLGMQVINERLNVLSKAKKITAKCEIKDLIDTTGEPSGTRVLLDMPYELE